MPAWQAVLPLRPQPQAAPAAPPAPRTAQRTARAQSVSRGRSSNEQQGRRRAAALCPRPKLPLCEHPCGCSALPRSPTVFVRVTHVSAVSFLFTTSITCRTAGWMQLPPAPHMQQRSAAFCHPISLTGQFASSCSLRPPMVLPLTGAPVPTPRLQHTLAAPLFAQPYKFSRLPRYIPCLQLMSQACVARHQLGPVSRLLPCFAPADAHFPSPTNSGTFYFDPQQMRLFSGRPRYKSSRPSKLDSAPGPGMAACNTD